MKVFDQCVTTQDDYSPVHFAVFPSLMLLVAQEVQRAVLAPLFRVNRSILSHQFQLALYPIPGGNSELCSTSLD